MTVSPAPAKPGFFKRWYATAATVVVWASSPDGRKELGAAVAAVTAVYVALHRAGV